MCAPKPPWATERGEEVKLQKTIVVYKKNTHHEYHDLSEILPPFFFTCRRLASSTSLMAQKEAQANSYCTDRTLLQRTGRT
jgi:hypothetical protein